MRRLISADINRIMHKKLLWICLGLGILLLGASALGFKVAFVWDGSIFTYAMGFAIPFLEFVFGILTLVYVYGEEVRSMTMITAIGRGLTREKLILAKFLDTVIISVMLNAVMSLFIFIFQLISGAGLTQSQGTLVYLTVFTGLYRTLGYLTVSALFLFITWSIPLSVLVYSAFNLLIPTAFLLFPDSTPVAVLHIDRYYFGSIAGMALTDFVLGLPTEGAALYLTGFLAYILLPLLLMMLVFRKKELDF